MKELINQREDETALVEQKNGESQGRRVQPKVKNSQKGYNLKEKNENIQQSFRMT